MARLNSGRSAIQRILMREILHGRPGTNCLVLNETGEPLPVPREYRARIRQLSFDVGVGPLRNTYFNRHKSSIRAVEYAATGQYNRKFLHCFSCFEFDNFKDN